MKTKILGLAIFVVAGLGLTFSYSRAVWSVQRHERLQHVPAPASYSGLANPFEHPQDQFCVVLREVGPSPDAVRAIVQGAVLNRSAEWAAELIKQVPCKIVEVTDEAKATAIEKQLREAGADGLARPVLDEFAALISGDRDSPIGKPTQVLDVEWLTTGRDAIAEWRESSEETGELVQRAFVAYTAAEGRALYQTNCRPCHGTKASGDGPMAAGFSLPPANLRDPNGIAALSPSEVLWRIEDGAPGLPRDATPWDSSMPAWKHELDRELVWKIILGEYGTANVTPKSSAESAHRHTQPAATARGPRLPEKGWLEWPVPAKPPAETTRAPAFVERGRYIYYYRCMPCHGVSGRGDGPAANTMWPRPRDFTDIPIGGFEEDKAPPKFKFRTTKQGWLPLDEDLYRTISRGLVGTAMEGWDDLLSPDEIWQVVAYLKTLSSAWNDPEHLARNPNDSVVVKQFTERDGAPPVIDYAAMQPPRVTRELIDEGRDVFLRFRCFECHGFEARGDGPAFGQHFDDWGYRMWPQNLANPLNYKAGHSIKDIYRSFANSLDGTVMPVYAANTLDQKDPKHGEYLQWALAAYVHSQVQTPTRGRDTTVNASSIAVRKTAGELPLNPLDKTWDDVPAAVVPLSGQVIAAPRWTAPSVTQVTVKAIYNADALALWLRWDDRRPNVTHRDMPADLEPIETDPLGPKTYAYPALRRSPKKEIPVIFEARDQLELQWPAKPSDADSPPFFFYGDEKKPVVLWRWLADRQGLTVRKELVEIAGAKTERLECTAAESDADLANHPVVVFRAAGLPLDPEAGGTQPSTTMRSRAHWSNGAWTLVLSRSLTTDDSADVQFAAHDVQDRSLTVRTPVPVAIHISDGLAGETGIRMAISSWVCLTFTEPRPAWHFVVAVTVTLATVLVVALSVRRFRRLFHATK